MTVKRSFRSVIFLVTAVMIFNVFTCMGVDAFNFTPKGYDENGKLQDISFYSKSVYMENLDTGETIVDINSEDQLPIASMTKVMTAVVLLDRVSHEESELRKTYVSAGTEAFDELYGTGAATADIQPDEKVSYYDLLAALLIPSACEAANIIAINVGGSIPEFVELMNKKASEIGMSRSHFSNAHGLFVQDNYSTAKDMALLCKYALEHYSVFKDLVAMNEYQMESTEYHETGSLLFNTNLMLDSLSDYYYASVKGIKTGTTEEAGRCLSTYATYDGQTYLIVTLGAPMEKLQEDYAKGEEDPGSIFADEEVYYNILDHLHLYKWAFSMLQSTDFINENSEVRDVKVQYGKDLDYANLKPANGYNQIWPIDVSVDDVEKVITVEENIVAPIEVGDVLGKMKLVYKGETLTEIDLVSTTRVDRSQSKARMKVVKSYFSSKVFKVTLTIVLTGIFLYGVIHFIRIQRKYLRKYADVPEEDDEE